MGFADSLARALVNRVSTAPSQRAMTWEDWNTGTAAMTSSGIKVTQESSLQLPVVWACVSLISDAISSMPIETFSTSSQVPAKVPNPSWIDLPNKDMTPYEFWTRVTTSLLLDGNAYAYIVRSETGAILELVPLHPSLVSVMLDEATGRRVYFVNGIGIDASDILHIPGIILPGDVKGRSPIDAAAAAIGLGLAAEEFGSKFFAQGATMSGVIEVPDTLDPESAKVMAQSFAANHSGTKRSHMPGVLTGGSTWKPITVNPNNAQFLETRQYQVADIARMFRVPPHLVGDVERSTSWGTGISEQNRNFIQFTLMPWTTRIEQAISTLLPRPRVVRFNADSMLRGTTRERFETYSVGIDAGFIQVNEARALEGLPPIQEPPAPAPAPATPMSDTNPADDIPAEQDGSTTPQGGQA